MIIGLDVGGTHTDVVLLGKDGILNEVKILTDHADLFGTVLKGIEKIAADICLDDVSRTVLSTTLTTNAVVQDELIPTGIIVSAGPGIDPEFYHTNAHYYSVSGSIDHRGREVQPVPPREIQNIARQLADQGIRHVGVIGKFSTRNPAHELAIYDIIKDSFEKVFLGHRVSGTLNFPRRIATTYLNAAVYPIHKTFFQAVEKSFREKGLKVPIHILKADGGTMSFNASIDLPAETILSGPAASVMGAIAYCGEGENLVLDIGGTTTDMAILVDGSPVLNPWGKTISGYKTLIRSLNTRSIGAGGDSAVRVKDGKLIVGPGRKGPAMAYGGAVPTPTDAMFVLGLIENGDREKSITGFERIAQELEMTIEDAAGRVFDQTCQMILDAASDMIEEINQKPVYTVHEILEGRRIKPKKLLVMGGPAPYFARRLETLSSYSAVTVPRWEVANAIGAALARTTCDVTLIADTERKIVTAPEEGYSIPTKAGFSKKDAIDIAMELLARKAVQRGAELKNLELEVLEEQEFNMVRGFYTAGKNIRIKVQVKPGLIQEFKKYTLDR